MASDREALPIERARLKEFAQAANDRLKKVRWKPKLMAAPKAPVVPGAPKWVEASIATKEETVSVIESVQQLCGDAVLLTEDAHHVLSVIRTGLTVGSYLSALYTKSTGLDQLIDLNGRGKLTSEQATEFRGKYQTASAIALFALAYYVAWNLSRYKTEEVGNIRLELDGIPELTLRSPLEATSCALYYYGAYLQSGAVHTDAELVRLTQLYFQQLLDELKLRRDSFLYLDPFTSRTYRLENSEFVVDGFSVDLNGGALSVEFNRLPLEKIVGNRPAKHFVRRLAQRLVCYRVLEKRNVMQDMRALCRLFMGYGKPGTGKSMLIAALATLLDDYCQMLEIPFLYHPLRGDIVSTFQGGSAERMIEWFAALKDPRRIVFAPIDDAENVLQRRTEQGVSAGIKEVVSIFLTSTESAQSVWHGNSVIFVATNLPDKIDDAALSRITDRVQINGAESEEDYLDQNFIWWKQYRDLDPSFVDLSDPDNYQYMSAQALVSCLSELVQVTDEPQETAIRDIFGRVQARHQPTEHAFLATLYSEVGKVYPGFSSRDVRNIQEAVDRRIMDFDLPSDWMENPDRFFRRAYDQQKAMLTELMRASMKGLSFRQVQLQEAVRYLDNMVRIADLGFNRQVEAAIQAHRIQTAVLKKLAAAK